MPLVVQAPAQPRCPRDFVLAAADNPPPTDFEQRCRARVNGYVTYLTGIPTDNTPRGQELIRLRDEYVGLLHDRADEVVAATLSAEEFLYTSYVYQGQFEGKVARLVAATFFVSAVGRQDGLEAVDFDISTGATTKEQAELFRAIKDTEVVVDVVMKRPRWAPRRVQWRARHDYYIQQLVDIGRIGLTEGNIDLAKGNLASLQGGFFAQHAETVKNRYVRRLGFWALAWVAANIALYVADCRYLMPMARGGWADGFLFLAGIGWRFRNFFLLAIGAALGAWLGFLIQRPTLQFPDLVQLDDNLLRPGMRIIFTIVLGTVVGLLFWTGMVLVSVGGFSTDFRTAGTPAMLIGAFCGIASSALVAAVSKRAREFAATVGGQAAPGGGAVP